jgi:nucleoside-diphosphate-sugar epimerase
MSPFLPLEGKTIWITGGAGYLGSVITRELDAQCAKVVCLDLPGRAEALERMLELGRLIPTNDALRLQLARLQRSLGRRDEAEVAYDMASGLTESPAVRDFLLARRAG